MPRDFTTILKRAEILGVPVFAFVATLGMLAAAVFDALFKNDRSPEVPSEPWEFVDVAGPFYFLLLVAIGMLAIFSAARIGTASKYDEIAADDLSFDPYDRESLSRLFSQSRRRLVAESARIHSISMMNLLIGLFFCVLGLGILGHGVVTGTKFEFEDYLPRAAIGILVQLVGFFFLRLFQAGESDIRFNKNEVTTIELKFMSLAVSGDNPEHKTAIISALANTDRNFVQGDRIRVASERHVELDDFVSKVKEMASVFDQSKTNKPKF